MKYKLINKQTGEEHLCEKVTIDGWDYYVSDEIPIINDYCIDTYSKLLTRCNKTNYGSNSYDFFKKVIATNNPNIDVPKVVDIIDELAIEWVFDINGKKWSNNDDTGGDNYGSYKAGYNKSQETHPNSDSDTAEFAEWLTLNTNSTSIHGEYIYKNVRRVTKELIQIWKEQRTKTLYYE